jgi:hypothetical protein
MDDHSRVFKRRIECYYCEETRTLITITDGEVELLTQEPPAQVLKRYPNARLMTFEDAMRLYMDSTLRRHH